VQTHLPGYVAAPVQTPLVVQPGTAKLRQLRQPIDPATVGPIDPVLSAQPRRSGIVKRRSPRDGLKASVGSGTIPHARNIAAAGDANAVAGAVHTVGVGYIANIARAAKSLAIRHIATISILSPVPSAGKIGIANHRPPRSMTIRIGHANRIQARAGSIAQACVNVGSPDAIFVLRADASQPRAVAGSITCSGVARSVTCVARSTAVAPQY
jgi:hypothetical protein